ncbi:MAG TPA: DUF2019 domain-containing protein [Stellaceae bacterium]|jgi:hypothetical protein|nr:DUF2019 domain-containing protein [Stellaceae bacterium]
MKTPNLQELSNEQLAERFKLLSFQEDEDACSAKYYQIAYDERSRVTAELRKRGQEARRALIPLLDCQDDSRGMSAVAQCHYNAARELLAVEPARARATLEKLANSVTQSQMFQARRTLEVLDNGTLKPT